MGSTINDRRDNRHFPRVGSGVSVDFHMADISGETKKYLTGVAENISIGGMFLSTPKRVRKGSVLLINFSLPDEAPFSASAIVRWTRRFKKPTGLGLEFVEFNGIGDRDFKALMDRIFVDTPPV